MFDKFPRLKVLVLESGHHRAEAHELYESYGFTHFARAYALEL